MDILRLQQPVRIGAALALALLGFPASQAAAAGSGPRAIAAVDVAPGNGTTLKKSTPEFEAFRKAWAGVANYSTTIVAHETTNDGKTVQDRTFRYTFVKPNAALISVLAGPGKGGGASWHGGSTVHAHKGGFVSFVKLTIPKDDPRVRSLRGDQIDVASFGYEVEHFSNVPGVLAENKTADGIAVTLISTTPDATGITREVLTLSPTTHLPVKHEAFVGEHVVKSESFNDLHLNNPELKADTLDI